MLRTSPQILLFLTVALGCQASGDGATATDSADAGPTGQQPRSGRCTPQRAITEMFYYDDSTQPLAGPRVDVKRQDGRTLMLRYEMSGPDVLWWTDDDGLTQYTRSEIVDGTLQTREFSGAGPDLDWLTADDTPQTAPSMICEPLDTAGRPRGRLQSLGAGPDGTFCTSDDLVESAFRIEYDARGAVIKNIGSSAPGPDGKRLTADDPVNWWARIDNEDDGVPRELYYTDTPGPDGRWFTSDDALDLLERWTYLGNEESESKVVGNVNGVVFGLHYYCHQPAPAPALH